MGAVIQSGLVTPGHLAAWVTDGVVGDGGPIPGTSEIMIGRLLGANFNSTSDQQIAISTFINKFQITRITVTNASISLTAAVGGFYPAVSKGGTALVAAGQAYSSLTTAASLLAATLASFATTTAFTPANLTAFSIYLSLTTPQGAPATADVYVFGLVLG